MNTTALKVERIELRASASVKQLLQDAAQAVHKNVSEFLLDAGVAAATAALAERQLFLLPETDWLAFQEALDRPVNTRQNLQKLLTEPGLLD